MQRYNWRCTKTEYNLEFQGSIWNLQKRALLWSFTQKCPEITQKCVKITLLYTKRALFVKYYKGQRPTTDTDFFWIIAWQKYNLIFWNLHTFISVWLICHLEKAKRKVNIFFAIQNRCGCSVPNQSWSGIQ